MEFEVADSFLGHLRNGAKARARDCEIEGRDARGLQDQQDGGWPVGGVHVHPSAREGRSGLVLSLFVFVPLSLIFRLCNPEIFDTPQITCVCFPDVRI